MVKYTYMKNIFVTRKIPEIAISMLKEKGYEVDVSPEDRILSQEEIINYLSKKEYDGVISLLTDNIDKNIFEKSKSVKIFANYATGFDNINLDDAKAYGVTITNAPAPLSAEAVAQHAISFMLALASRIVEADKFVREGKYVGWEPMHFMGTDFLGKTLALVGGGRIGERVAFYAKGLGLKIIYTDIAQNERLEKEYGAVYFKTLDEVLKQADFVSLHVPLLPSTKHLINKEKLSLMKPTSFLINTSRGPVVDEEALRDALKSRVIAGAGLDVFEFEPKLVDGLVDLPNIIMTPHIASANLDAREQMSQIVAENVIDFFEGRVPKNIVNK
ncbi:MAG: D-isomer specific 2-hydroxyacid dehydrogenase, NAD-binding protein [Patescibacteria group bacterium]|nr:D-isomer specific 2-hydroxyacid dehydrogenase, NAD-binding protein [Patescibacteria group bacterium]